MLGIGIYNYPDEVQEFANKVIEGIYNYQDEVQEFANKVIEKTMGLSEAAKEKILSLLGEMKEKNMNVQYPCVPNSNPIQPRRGTECSGKNNSKIKLPPKFLQNPLLVGLLGCQWRAFLGKITCMICQSSAEGLFSL